MTDETSNSDCRSPKTPSFLKLGYLIQQNNTQPFSLTLQDLTNLFVIGDRSQDIYYNLLIQLVDDHHVPVLIILGDATDGYEDQICESPFWTLDLSTDSITFNPFTLGDGLNPSHQITILIDLLEEFIPLSPTAKNLLHIITWKQIFSSSQPTIRDLHAILAFYSHYGPAYQEIRRLFEVLPDEILNASYDNVSLARIQHLPTIISTSDRPYSKFILNILLLKLLSQGGTELPPLFLMDPPTIHPKLLQWLCSRYSSTISPLVYFAPHDRLSQIDPAHLHNLIFTLSKNSTDSFLRKYLTEEEHLVLSNNCDHAAVKLRNKPSTQMITIF